MKTIRKSTSKAGLTFVELLVGTAILLAMSVIGLEMFRSARTSVELGARLGRKEDARLFLRRNFNCAETIARESAACDRCAATPIRGYDASGRPLMGEGGVKQWGDTKVLLSCALDGQSYLINARMYDDRGNLEPDNIFEVPITCKMPPACGYNQSGPDTQTFNLSVGTAVVVNEANRCGVPAPILKPFRRSFGGSGGGNLWNNEGTLDMATLTRVCNTLGFENYVTSACYAPDSKKPVQPNDPIRTRKSKCNFHSPGDNYIVYWDGANWRTIHGPSKYGNTWIAHITCQGKKPLTEGGAAQCVR